MEAVLEQPEIKGSVLKSIEAAARPDVIFGTNTSILSIGELAENLRDAECFLGLHFAYPAPFIPGVEMIAHTGTDEAVVPAAEATLALAGKLCARVNDKVGFVLNRLQFVLLKEAANIVAEGVAKAEDIDAIVRTTFGFRLPFFGPFAIADIASLDVFQDCFTTFQDYYGERMAAPAMLTELVNTGHQRCETGWRVRHPRRGPVRTDRLPQHCVRQARPAPARTRPSPKESPWLSFLCCCGVSCML